jgi:hypothetical protein
LILASALKLDDEYVLRRPIAYRNFNSRDYPTGSPQLLLADIEAMIEHAVIERLEVDRKQIGEWSAILVVPEFLDRTWVKEWCQILLRGLGFGRVCVQQVRIILSSSETSSLTWDEGISRCNVWRRHHKRMCSGYRRHHDEYRSR